MTHKCPGPDCTVDVPQEQLACKRHWFQLPQELRSRIWRYWRSGDERHGEAITEAIAFLNPVTPA